METGPDKPGNHAAYVFWQPLESGTDFRESVLFIGTQFSILYTSMYSPA